MVEQVTVRILNGGVNMPAFGSILTSEGMTFFVGVSGIAKCQFKHTAGAGPRSEISMRAHSRKENRCPKQAQ